MENTIGRLYSTSEAAKVLGVSIRTIYRYVDSGRLKAKRLGTKTIKIAEEDLKRFINGE